MIKFWNLKTLTFKFIFSGSFIFKAFEFLAIWPNFLGNANETSIIWQFMHFNTQDIFILLRLTCCVQFYKWAFLLPYKPYDQILLMGRIWMLWQYWLNSLMTLLRVWNTALQDKINQMFYVTKDAISALIHKFPWGLHSW